MPIEIRELHIRVSVGAPAAPPGGTSGGPGASASAPDGGEEARRELVAECVEQVLAVLRDRKER